MTVNIGLPEDGIPNQGWKLYLVSLIFIITAGIVVLARCYTRITAREQRLGADDYTIIVSLIFSIVLSASIQLAVVNGYGKHKAHLTKAELTNALRWFFIAQIPYKIVVCLNKVSVLLLYRRIFVTKSFRRGCYAVMAIVVVWSIGSTFSTIFQCMPITASWDKTVPASCINSNIAWIAYAVINIVTDFMVLALPIPEIFKLHLRTSHKIMLCGVFLMGGFVTVTSVLRVTAVANSVRNQADITWSFIPRGIWTLVEANTGMICACLPILRLTLRQFFPCIFSSPTTTRTSSYSKHTSDDYERKYRLSDMNGRTLKALPKVWNGRSSGWLDSKTRSNLCDQSTLSRDSDEESIIGMDRRQGRPFEFRSSTYGSNKSEAPTKEHNGARTWYNANAK